MSCWSDLLVKETNLNPAILLDKLFQEAVISDVTYSELVGGLSLVPEARVEFHEEWKVLHDKLVHDRLWESRESQEFCAFRDLGEVGVVVKFRHDHCLGVLR